MNDAQREAIYENAKYLRYVRPIDPEEIDEYVPGRPHPAVVRETLRAGAFELGLIERADGTFVPAAEKPVAIDPPTEPIEFPERYARRLEDRLVARFGPGWPEGASGDRLRGVIRTLKESYFAGERVEYDAETALAYAIYHLPDYYAVTRHLLAALATTDRLSTRLRVLDIGAGVGGPAVGLFDALPEHALCEYHAVEPSPAADVLADFLADAGRNRYPTIHRERAEAFEPTGEYDLIVVANALSELDDPVQLLDRYCSHLAAEGTLLLAAPADRETATGLRTVERALADNGSVGEREQRTLTVYEPTVRLWPGRTPTDRCWSFDVAAPISTPPFQRRLDEAATDPEHEPGEFINRDVQYAYSVLRADGARRYDFEPNPDRSVCFADSETAVTDRVNAVAIKLSHSLSADREDANPVFLIGDGSQQIDHYAVVTRETSLNAALRDSEYGTLLVFENVLVLWNADEGSYNLVVDDETVVEAIPA